MLIVLGESTFYTVRYDKSNVHIAYNSALAIDHVPSHGLEGVDNAMNSEHAGYSRFKAFACAVISYYVHIYNSIYIIYTLYVITLN